MWALESFSAPKHLSKDLELLSMTAELYLLYKREENDFSLLSDIYALYHTQLCDSSLQEIVSFLMPHLHHPDDFITAFENFSLSHTGMTTWIWKWLHSISTSIYHHIQEAKNTEKILFQIFMVFLSLTAAKNFATLEEDFWEWPSLTKKNFSSLFPHFISNYFLSKMNQSVKKNREEHKKMCEKFLHLFPANLLAHPLFDNMYKTTKKNFEDASHQPSFEKKWIQETKEQFLFYFSMDNGFVKTYQHIENISTLYHYIQEILSLFSSPLSLKNLQIITQKLQKTPMIAEEKHPLIERAYSALLSWKESFFHATSYSVSYYDPKKRVSYSGKVPEPLSFSLLHPELVQVTLFTHTHEGYTTHLSFLFTKELTFQGLPDPKHELEPFLYLLA